MLEQPDNAWWLAHQGFIFPLSTDLPYWTSTSSADNPTVNAWVVDMVDGSVFPDNKGLSSIFYGLYGEQVIHHSQQTFLRDRLLRPARLRFTRRYDDAYFAITPTLNVGVPWPDPRFTVTYCDSTGPCAEQLVDCDLNSSIMWLRTT